MRNFDAPGIRNQLIKFAAAAIIVLAAINPVKANVATYTFASSSGNYSAITGTSLASGTWDDVASSLITLPFSFTYNNTSYTTIGISSNGYVTMGAVAGSTVYCGLQGSPVNSIAGYGTDLVGASSSSSVQYGTRGTSPNRQFVIQYIDCDHYNLGSVDHWTFQIILNETSNTVQVVWGSSTDVTTMGANSCSDASTESGNVGLLGSSTSDFNLRSVTNGTNSWSASVVGTSLSTVCNISSSNIPASGLTYTWTPGVAGPMTYVSSTTAFLNSGSGVGQDATSDQIVQVQVVTSGSTSPLSVTSLALSTTGCTNTSGDLANAKVYFTGNSSAFSTATQFGSTVNSPNGAYSVTGAATLSEGTNYFWITYDITSGATIGDNLAGCCTSITGSGTMGTVTPTVTCPSGNQTISQQGSWIAVTAAAPHQCGGGMLLLTDGSILTKSFSGGTDGYGNIYDKLTPDANGSYVNGTWSSIAAMHNTRLYYSSQVLKDGRVYVCGGEYGSGGSSGETYDPLTNVWTNCPAVGSTVSDANSEILPDGKVLQALVSGSLTGTKIYDPATNTYATGPTALGIHNESAWVKLPDNSILYVNRLSTSSERYIPSQNQWIADATVPVSLYDPYGDETGGGLLLPDGRAFFLGSSGHTAYYTPSGNTSNGTWTAGPDIPSSRGTPDAPAAMMVNGKILCTVSPVPTSANHFPTPTYFYEFDYVSNTFTQINAPGGGTSVNESTYVTSMLDLPDGKVLFGTQGSSQYYVYVPGSSALSSGKPTISSVTQTSCTNYMITGTQFNGISEGACYGDDWQMASNYPIVRLNSGSTTYYARTSNWNSTGVKRGTAADTAQFTLPSSLPNGTYSLVVSSNGFSSDPITFVYPGVSFSGLASTYQVTDPPATLTGTPSGGTFSGPGISGNTFNPASAGVGGPYTITYTYCSHTSSAQTTVVSNCGVGAAGTISGSSSVCAGSSGVAFSVAPISNATGYVWGLPAGASIASGSNTNSITVNFTTNASSGNVTVSGTNGSCSGASSSLSLTVNPLPNVTALNVSGCTGSAIALSGTPAGGTWSVANPYTGPSTTYTHTYTDANGCTNTSASATITVNPLPTVTADNVSGCQGTPIALSGTPSGGTWSVANPYTGPGTTYTHTYTDGNGCTNTSASATITVNPLPTVSTGSYSNVCDTVTSVALGGTPSGGTWSGPGVSGNAFHPNTAGAGTWTITYSYTDANGCTGSASTQITVVACCVTPAQPGPITGSTAFCRSTNGHPYSISAVSGATSYTWTVPSGATIASGQGTTSITVNFSSSASNGNLCVTASNTCGTSPSSCLSLTGTGSKPARPSSVTGATNNLCNATSVAYSCPAVSGATSYTWTVPSGATVATGQGTTNITVNFGTFTTGSVCVTANNACGGSTSRCLNVTSIPVTPSSITGPTSVCAHQSGINYSCATQSGATYTWTVPNGVTINSGQGTGSILVTWGTTGGQVRVTPSNSCGSAAKRSLSVSVTCRGNMDEALQDINLAVAPNPVDDILHVTFDSPAEGTFTLRLIDVIGQTMMMQSGMTTEGANELMLNMSALPKGIYMLEMINGDARGMKKIVVN